MMSVICRQRHAILCAGIAQPGDDYNYGSAGVLDVLCLQALSKRIHYGKYVAEAKFRYSWMLLCDIMGALAEVDNW